MNKAKHNRLGREYHPVTTLDLLLCLADSVSPMYAEEVGEILWPHLIGRGSPRGGPSACNYTASCQLGRLRAKGLVEMRFDSRYAKTWSLTSQGREKINEKVHPTDSIADGVRASTTKASPSRASARRLRVSGGSRKGKR